MTSKFYYIVKKIQIFFKFAQFLLIPLSLFIPSGYTAKFHNEVTFLDFPGQITIDVFKQNWNSEMI